MRREHLFEIRMPIPPLSVQDSLVIYLTNLEQRVTSAVDQYRDSKQEIDALLPSILDKAFRGEL